MRAKIAGQRRADEISKKVAKAADAPHIPVSELFRKDVEDERVGPAPEEFRDFGVLKVRKMKQKGSQALVFDGSTTDFSSMSNEDLKAIVEGTNEEQIREFSKWFYKTNGIYSRAVRYLADLYRYDFLLYPNLAAGEDLEEADTDSILEVFEEALEYFDRSAIQLMSRKWAMQVCIEGVYYGYVVDDVKDKLVVQDLPTNYCRSRFFTKGIPVVEFNATYFDDLSTDEVYKAKILELFPKEFQVGYQEYLRGKLTAETQGDTEGWFMLDVNRAFKFDFGVNTLPPFLSSIPEMLDLDEVQDLAKEQLLQELQKILVQKFELTPSGQLPFTMNELQRLNQNAVDMVGDTIGISVLSTVAEVSLEDVASSSDETSDAVDTAEDSVYTSLGISSNLFNTEGSLALEKSILCDEAFVKPLALQFERFFNNHIEQLYGKKETGIRLKMLNTTIFNYIEMSDKYKDLTKIGFSRFLPMVALGHTQKEVISLVKTEQQIMGLDDWMLPPFSSNTMSSDTWSDIKAIQNGGADVMGDAAEAMDSAADAAASIGESENEGGRPELSNDKKSDKTIANNESMS